MRVKAITVQKVAMGAALIGALAWNLAEASELGGVRTTVDATGTRTILDLDATTQYQILKLANPNRLVVDLTDTDIPAKAALVPGGWVSGIRTGVTDTGSRVVLDLQGTASRVRSKIETVGGQRRLVLTFPGQGAQVAAATVPKPASVSSVASLPTKVEVTSAPVADTARDRDLNALISDLAGPSSSGTAVASAEPKVMPAAAMSQPQAQLNGAASNAAVTIATGVPTRRATGVPTALTAKGAAALKAGVAVNPPRSTPAPAAVTRPASAAGAVQSVSELRGERLNRGERKLVVAIDAGHGGQDPGARGLNGTREKDVTLQIARELARQVNATPGMRAVLTRDSDFFVELTDRPRIARRAGADVFVSIHADAAENRRADGSSVYVLSTRGASSQRARWLADKENAADMMGGVKLAQASNSLANVLIDLTQSGHMRASEDAANNVLAGLKRVGNIHKYNVEKANFAVLRGSDMPSMLVETAFISNPDEEQRLLDPAFQRRIAGAVLDGVHTYFSRLAPPGTIYASLADEEAGPTGGSD